MNTDTLYKELTGRDYKRTFYFYAPIPHYAGKILKCKGMATDANTAWFLEQNPGTIVLAGYRGDRIRAGSLRVVLHD
jgi:hypothetical protein